MSTETNYDSMQKPLKKYITRITQKTSRMLLVLGLVLATCNLNAQIWEFSFGGNFEDQGFGVTQARNNDFVVTGSSDIFFNLLKVLM